MVITVVMIHLLPWLHAVALLEELEAPASCPSTAVLVLEPNRLIKSGPV